MDNKRNPRRLALHRAAMAWLLSGLLCCALGTVDALAQPASAASGAALPAPSDVRAIRARIATDDRRRPVVSIELAQEALADVSLSSEDQRWLRSRLIRDLVRMHRNDGALAQAQLGHKQARTLKDQVHFGTLELLALNEARRYDDLLKRYQGFAASLPALANDTQDAAASMDAANAWRLAGSALLGTGRLPDSMNLLTSALRVFDARTDAAYEVSETLTTMALLHSRSGHVDEALRTVQRAIDGSEAAGDRSNLSSYYLRKAYFLGLLDRDNEQQATLLTARTLAQEELSDYNLAVAATNLADVALKRQDYHGTLKYAQEAIPLVERSGDKESLWVCWVNKGTALNRLGRPGGIEWIRKAIAAFATAPGMAGNVAEVHGLLAEELAFNHDFEPAYQAAMQFQRLTDQVRKAADQKRIAQANAAYESDKRQRQIDTLEQEQHHQQSFRWVLALAAAAGLAAAVVAVVSRHHVKRAYRAMRDMAFSDPLTGLRNRRHLESTVDEDVAQALRLRASAQGDGAAGNTDLAFMMIDIDHFKAVNDVHGHAAGDAVLKQCAALLQQQLRGSDTLVRWGGEEFLVLARLANPQEIHALAERLRVGLAAHPFVLGDGQVLHKTCSIGFACHPLGGGSPEQQDWHDTVSLADQCLYVAKASGRDLWVGIDPHGARQVEDGLDVRDLRAGVDAGVWALRWTPGRSLAWPSAA
ncbi:diguanylate cyclase [Roseateles sp.]|uniref:GGDEF domain-containing protein n=1 Tax=Roseateles sp. TaxID=1971397 RepID=UPI0032638D3F